MGRCMRKGFTLVEIMVVVVILGVLAGVGVPKLFGVIAKARASEVPVAAGTYVSLQNAYLHENNGIGSWKNIGYGAPGDGQTEYFDYSGCINGTIVFDQMEPDMPGWQATSRAGLNSCVTGSAWAVVIDPAGEREIDYRKIISSPECAALTTTWGVVGETVEGMCETTGELHVAGTENKTPDKPETPTETPTEDPSDPEPSAPPQEGENTTAQSSSSQQGDCDALASSIKNDNGNKYGWVCVSACGMFAPPGKARNAGFTVGDAPKKKQTGGTCEKVEPESGTGSSAGSSATQSSASSSTSTVPGSSSNETLPDDKKDGTDGEGGGPVVKGSASETGYKGFGDYKDYNSDEDVCLDYDKKNKTCEEWMEKGYAGTDENASGNFNSNTDYCIHSTTGNTNGCDVWIHKTECKEKAKHGNTYFCTTW